MPKEWTMEDWKQCAICKETFQIKDFAPNKVRGVYQYNRCKPCNKKRKHDWNKANYERQYEMQKQRYKENPEFYRNIAKRYKKANPDKVKEQKKRWREKYSEYYKNKAYNAQYLRNSGIIKELIDIQENTCLYCGRTFKIENLTEYSEDKYTLDHWIPTRVEEDHSYSNLSLCCFKCNTTKTHQSPEKVFGLEKSQELYNIIIGNAEILVNRLNKKFGHNIEIYENVSKLHFKQKVEGATEDNFLD